MKPIIKTPQKAVNTRQINAICSVKIECGEVREIPKSVIVTDASRANVQAELAKQFKGLLLSFRVSRISSVYG